jgi:MOSC domain-containing protein YiiM
MQEVGNVQALFISRKTIPEPVERETIHADPKGILEDKHYGSTPERTVLIASLESYLMAQRELGTRMPYGYLGENLLIDYNPYHLPLGTKLQAGSVTLEITQNCTLCNHLAKLDKRIPKLLKNDRGIFAKVVKAGEIKVGDTVSILS